MELSYEVVDVFTDRAYAGNPLAVVLDAERLGTEQLQAMAREFHLSETAFPMRSERGNYRLRIFTPSVELPFAGHPSVGAAAVLARLGRIPTGRVVQECGAGLLPLEVRDGGATLTGGTPSYAGPVEPGPVLGAVGLDAADLAGEPSRAGCGIDFTYLPVRAEALDRVRPDLAAVAALGGTGLSVNAWDGSTARTRVFAAGAGVAEDPATGSAALGFGVHLVAAGLLPADGESAYDVVQGVEMGRPSLLRCTVLARSGTAVEARVSGDVVPVARGTIVVPPA